MSEKTFNPCDECGYSHSKENQDSKMCNICEFKKLQEMNLVKHGGAETETETIRDKAVKWNNNSSKRVPYEFIDYIEGKRDIGVSNDYCEWHKVKNANAYKCNTHAEIHDSRALDWVKCPYCGKKIKITEKKEIDCSCLYIDRSRI